MPKRELPFLAYGGNAEFLSAELDYEEMVALSGICRLAALYDPNWTPEQRMELICYSADFERLAEWVGVGWCASDPSGAAPACALLASRARRRRSVIKLEHAKHWLGRTLPQNDRLLNRVARRWLNEANVQPDPHSLHLLTLARWGFENGAEGDWPENLRDAVKTQLEGLAQWNAEELMRWLFANEDEGDPKEQEQELLRLLKEANGPLQAAEMVLCTIWFMM